MAISKFRRPLHDYHGENEITFTEVKLKRIFKSAYALLNNAEQRKLIKYTILGTLNSLLDILVLVFMLAVISLYSGVGEEKFTFFFFNLNRSETLWPIFTFLGLFLGKNLLGYFVFKTQSQFVYQVASRISLAQLHLYLNGKYDDYIKIDHSKQVNKINHEPIEFAQYVLMGMQQVCTELFLISLAIIAIICFNASIFILLVIFLLPPILIILLFLKRKLKQVKLNVKFDAEMSNQYLQESLNSYIECAIYQKQSFFSERYIVFQQKLNAHLSQLQIAQWIPSRLVEMFAVLGLFIMIILSIVFDFKTEIFSIGAFMAAAYKIIPGIVRIVNLTTLMKTYAYTIDDLNIEPGSCSISNVEFNSINKIQFLNVSFSFDTKKVFDNFNCSIVSGDFVWVSGDSGRGKTTLINLLLGFLTENKGEICFNGTSLNSIERASCRQCFSYVKQQVFLIHDTILKNIVLDDTFDENRFAIAIDIAGLNPLIESFEEGVHKIINQSGKNISGGQRKRIAIARAIYNNADILILDEPFNELDEFSERIILEKLKALCNKGKVVILLSHSELSGDFCTKTILIND